ncbi:SDR family NAD(P)-dependent oxidoreductase, partial [candidate division KSB1 bacterium]|nr:SDR family NAD(P)-dependent oxidoreductase [candidate division KSB1 bacterium]
MDWKNKQILVTGAGGFIGSHLTEQLVTAGAKVRAFVHYNSRNDWGLLERLPAEVKARIEIFLGEIQDPFAVRQAVSGCEVVFHLAALIAIPYSYRAPASYVDTNVKGTLNVMQACLDAGVKKVVHTSTSETYGSAIYTPIDEQHPLQGQSPYSASKIGADKIAESYWLSFGLPVATIRPFNTYGPRQSARAVIPTIITQTLTRDQIHLGSLTPVRDLNYVADTVAGFIQVAAAENSIGEVINIGFGQGITIGELAQKIFNLMGKTVPIVMTD